jgi:hypothetical protein
MPKQYKTPTNPNERFDLAVVIETAERKSLRLFAEKWRIKHANCGLTKEDAARIAPIAADPKSLVGSQRDETILEIISYTPDGFAALFTALRTELRRRRKSKRGVVASAVNREFVNSGIRLLDTKMIRERGKLPDDCKDRDIQRALKAREGQLLRLRAQQAAVKRLNKK